MNVDERILGRRVVVLVDRPRWKFWQGHRFIAGGTLTAISVAGDVHGDSRTTVDLTSRPEMRTWVR